MDVYAVIMAGGSGTRFWPASRRDRPKQYLPISGAEPLLTQTLARLADLVPIERVLVVTARSQVAEVRRTLPALPESNILAEPSARNTAPCVAWAADEIGRRSPESLQVVLPADHVIRPVQAFQRTLRAALEEGEDSRALITFGIRPTFPATGFGYIESGERCSTRDGLDVLRVRRFVEKPDLERAKQFLAAGSFSWNAGIFVWRTDAILAAVAEHTPEIARGLDEIARGASLDAIYPRLPSVSIDVGVMERARDVRMLAIDYFWSDVGSWTALPEVLQADADDNFTTGGTALTARDAHGNIVYGESGQLTALIGVDNLVIVRAGNAVLVCPRDRAQEVKGLVERLQRENSPFL